MEQSLEDSVFNHFFNAKVDPKAGKQHSDEYFLVYLLFKSEGDREWVGFPRDPQCEEFCAAVNHAEMDFFHR